MYLIKISKMGRVIIMGPTLASFSLRESRENPVTVGHRAEDRDRTFRPVTPFWVTGCHPLSDRERRSLAQRR